ncbi:MAG: fused MFS/spermidine synthase [Micrococcales bacterium]|nr:fused MFS/spermidine synthase [Micrococcales bacterium]
MELDPRLVPDRDRPGAWTVNCGGADQSYVDPADPTYLEFFYVQRIADVIDTSFPPGQRISVLHVGGAGLTIPRYVAHTRPTSAQIVFEPDETLTMAVRQVVPLPRHSGIKIRPVDGCTGLAAIRDDYADLVVIDAFHGSQVPAEFASKGWWAELQRVVHQGGTVTMNVIDHAPFHYTKRLVAGAQRAFAKVIVGAEPAVLRGRRFGNVLITAGHFSSAKLEQAAWAAAFPFRYIQGPDLGQWLSKAQPFTDQDAESSPLPPPNWRSSA